MSVLFRKSAVLSVAVRGFRLLLATMAAAATTANADVSLQMPTPTLESLSSGASISSTPEGDFFSYYELAIGYSLYSWDVPEYTNRLGNTDSEEYASALTYQIEYGFSWRSWLYAGATLSLWSDMEDEVERSSNGLQGISAGWHAKASLPFAFARPYVGYGQHCWAAELQLSSGSATAEGDAKVDGCSGVLRTGVAFTINYPNVSSLYLEYSRSHLDFITANGVSIGFRGAF